MMKHDQSFLTRFYGLYKMIKGNSKEVNFVVMANVLSTDMTVHEQYDLKVGLPKTFFPMNSIAI